MGSIWRGMYIPAPQREPETKGTPRMKRILPPEDLLCYKVDFADGEAPDIRFDGEMNHEIHETHEAAAEVDRPRGTAREERDASGVRFIWQDGDAPDANKSWRGVMVRCGSCQGIHGCGDARPRHQPRTTWHRPGPARAAALRSVDGLAGQVSGIGHFVEMPLPGRTRPRRVRTTNHSPHLRKRHRCDCCRGRSGERGWE